MVRDATDAYLAAEDAFKAWIDAELEPDNKAFEMTTSLYGSFSAWCKQSGEPLRSRKEFLQATENGDGFLETRDQNGQRGFKGYRIKPKLVDGNETYREQYQ